jgi:5-methylcytosine-specific restriction endonuclease McrA
VTKFDASVKNISSKKNIFRLEKFVEQKGLCAYCNKEMSFARKAKGGPARNFATFEHLVKKRDGGLFTKENIVLACSKCNMKREIIDDARAKEKK